MSPIIKKIVSFIKKIALIVGVYAVIITIFFSFWGKKQVENKNNIDSIHQTRKLIYDVINDKKTLSSKDGKIGILAFRTITCVTMGEGCTDNPEDANKNYENSVLGYAGKLIVLPYTNPPFSGIYWVHSGLQDAGFISKSYASEGIGSSSLKIFKDIWIVFRNLTFLILVIVIIAIGFMIMFRTKINPQTVISIENSLPRIVIALLLITFSYAIAGFLVDLMYLIIILFLDILSKTGGFDVGEKFGSYIGGTPFFNGDLFNITTYYNGLMGIYYILPSVMQEMLHLVFSVAIFVLFTSIFPKLFQTLANLFPFEIHGTPAGVGASSVVSNMIAGIISIVIAFILAPVFLKIILMVLVFLGLLTLMFRIFFMLLYSYIQFLIYVLFAPLFLLIEAVPGQKGFVPWLRNLFGNLIVFPAVIILLTIVNIISNKIMISSTPSTLFVPPLLSTLNTNSLLAIINAMFLLMIPDLVKTLKQAVIGKEGIQIPASANVLFGPVGGAVSGGVGLMSQLSSIKLGMGALGRGFGFLGLQTDPSSPKKNIQEAIGKSPNKG